MKHLILLLAIVAVSCHGKQKTHIPKWYWLCQDSTGGAAVDTSLCSIDSIIGDTTFITSKSDGAVILTKIRQRFDFNNQPRPAEINDSATLEAAVQDGKRISQVR